MTEDGIIGLGERFERMEASLGRIEDKLDTKVDVRDFARLEKRLDSIEGGTTPLGQWFLKEYEDVKVRLHTIESGGSREAQEALELGRGLEMEVAALKDDYERRAERVKALSEASAGRYQAWVFALGVIGAFNVVVNMLQAAGVLR